MVSSTMLYRGPRLDFQAAPSTPVSFTQYMGYEPGQTTYWSSQGLVSTHLPFVGGARITSGFWSHESFRFVRWTLGPHGGIDFTNLGDDDMVKVMVEGRVVGNEWSDSAGFITTLKIAPNLFMDYAHMEELPGVNVGDRLGAGSELATMGETGTFATGRHLHMSTYTMTSPLHGWGNWINRLFLDPLPYLGDMFAPMPVFRGPNFVTFKGGLIDLLDIEGQEQNLSSVITTDDGGLAIYVPGAPEFVNQQFRDLFPEDWIHAGTPLLAVRR